jgi:putative FmdB family regulatory protein
VLTYYYECKNCEEKIEAVQRITDQPLKVCPKCGQYALHRLITGGSDVFFSGPSWARDLYTSSRTKQTEK